MCSNNEHSDNYYNDYYYASGSGAESASSAARGEGPETQRHINGVVCIYKQGRIHMYIYIYIYISLFAV